MPANLIRLTRLFLYRNPLICICRFIKQVVMIIYYINIYGTLKHSQDTRVRVLVSKRSFKHLRLQFSAQNFPRGVLGKTVHHHHTAQSLVRSDVSRYEPAE